MRALALLGLLLMGQTFALDGGLDYQTHALFAKPGTLSDCCNFERSVEQGYRRVDGIISFDGFEQSNTIIYDTVIVVAGPSSGFIDFLNALDTEEFYFTSNPNDTGDFIQSSTFQFLYAPTRTVLDPSQIQLTGRMIGPIGAQLPALYNEQSSVTVTVSVSGVPTSRFVSVDFFQQQPIAYGIDENYLGKVTSIPGRTDSDVHFTHLYKDDVYAGRDYEAYEVTGTNATTSVLIRNGDVVTNGTDFATVIIADGGFGFEAKGKLIVHKEHGKFAVGETLYLVGAGSFSNPMTQGGMHGPLSSIGGTWALTEIGTVTALTDETRAGLYKTLTTGGWSEVDQLREVRFSSGQSAMSALVGVLRGSQISNETVTTEGPKYGSATKSLVGFTSADAVTADDASTTSCASLVAFDRVAMKVQGFDLSAVPVNANIVGVMVEIERKASALDTGSDPQWVQDNRIHLIGVGSTGILIGTLESALLSSSNKAAATEKWGTSYVTKSYGSASDLWGQAITPAQLKSPDFGVYVECLRSIRSGGSTSDTAAEIDFIRLTVYYQNATSRVHFYNANGSPTNIAGDVVQVHLISGSYAANSAEGILTVKMDSVASNGRNAEVGDQIRSADGPAGGVLYATVSSPMIPVTLPSQSDLDEAGSMYRAINANFYGSEDFEAAYLANGAGPAFAIDPIGVVRIHPDLTSDLNKPRHLAKHGDLLAIGFKNGSVLFSVAGEPLNLRGVDGATEVAIGDKVTGLLPLEYDVLGVFCESRIEGIRGLVPELFQKTVIRPNSGAIEYSVVDMGFPVYVHSFGIDMLGTTDKFGDFGTTPMSELVWPWLRPRIQSLSSDNTLRVKLAYPVRNKNQYRIVFGDGYAMTMTLVGMERQPQFTIQRWHYDDGSTDAVFVPRHISSGIDSRGVERIFATMAYDARWNLSGQQYVYEVDKLWFFTFWDEDAETFNARPIQSFIVTNWTDEDSATVLKRFDQFNIFGRSQFPVTFQASRNVNYQLTTDASGDVTVSVDCTFGASGEIVPPIAYNRMTTAHLAIEGFNVAIRFDSEASDTPPFTLSAISMTSDYRGNTRGRLTT